MGVQSSILPLLPGLTQIAGHGLSYTAVSGPLAVPISLSHGPAAVIAAASPPIVAAHSPIVAAHAPLVHQAAHSPAVVVAHGAPVPGGAYVAQTRGAVHTAPLPGHISSVANLNVAPAPGTL